MYTSMTIPHSEQYPWYLEMWESPLKGVSKSGFGMSEIPQEGHRVFLIFENSSLSGPVTVSSVPSSSSRISSLGIVLKAMGGP